MQTKFFLYFWFAITLTSTLVTSELTYSQTYGGYPNGNISGYVTNPYPPTSAYVANREMMPQSATTSVVVPPQTNPLKSPIATTSAVPVAPTSSQDAEKGSTTKTDATNPLSEKKSKPSFFTSFFNFSNKGDKSASGSSKSKSQDLLKDVDDGQETIETLAKERNYSEPDYVNSATRSIGTAAKDHYKQGVQSEAQGDFSGAVQHYNAFIAANKKQTQNGTLAAPYHRLALIAWKLGEIRNTNIYFRYAMKYAQSGNVPIIAGDYALFLMERNDLTQAEVILRNALISYPENNRLLYYLGRCTVRQDKPMESLRLFIAAMGEDRAYQELVLLYRQQGEFEMAAAMDVKRNDYLARQNRTAPQQMFASQYQNPNYRQPVPTAPPPVMSNPRGMLSQATLGTPIPFPTFNNPEGQREQVYMPPSANIVKPQEIPVAQPPEVKIRQQPTPPVAQPQEIPVVQWQAKPIVEPQENIFAQWQTQPTTYQQENIAVQWQATSAAPQEKYTAQWQQATPAIQPQLTQGNPLTVSDNNWQPMAASTPPLSVGAIPAPVMTAPISKVFYYPANETSPIYQEF